MRRLAPLLVAVAAFALVAGACGGDSPDTAAAPEAADSDEVFAFTATTVSGEPYDASQLVGRDVAVWFWAPW